MSEWQRIADIADTNPETLSDGTEREYLFRYIDLGSVDAGCIDWNTVRTIKFEDAPSRARRRVKAGDVLFGTVRPNLQSHGYVPQDQAGELVASTGFSVIRPRHGLSDGRYIFFAILGGDVYAQSVNVAVGSNYPAVSDRDVREFRIFAPRLEEQEKIAQILDTLDTQIRQTEALIAKLERIKQGLLTDLLTRGIDENGQLRPPPEDAPHLYKDSPLGWIPRGWEVLTAENWCDSVTDGTHDSPKPAKTGYPLVTSKNLKPDGLDLDDVYLISKRDYESVVARSWVEPGDILFGMIGTVGNPAIIEAGQHRIAPKNVGIFRAGGDYTKGRFLLSVLGSRVVSRQVDLATSGSTQKFVGLGILRRLLLPLPMRREIDAIVGLIEKYDVRLCAERSELEKLNVEKTGLMDDLLTGRVRVAPLLDTAKQAYG